MMTSVLLLVASVFVAPDFANVFPPSIRTIGVVMPASILDKAVADNAGVDFVRVLSDETTPGDLKAYKGVPPAIVVYMFNEVENTKG